MRAIRIALPGLLLLCTASAHAEWFADSRDKMGTRVEVRFWHEDATFAETLLAQSMAEFDRIEALMSTYLADSEISAVNAGAADGPVKIGNELYVVIEQALMLSQKTNGAFDITYDSVGRLYDYRSGLRPDVGEIEKSLPAIDYRHVLLDTGKNTIRFAQPGVRINLGGIAKGYAVETVIDLLREAGVVSALVSAGGDTRLLGNRGNGPWIVGVRDPDDEQGIVTRLALEDEAISTSGDYERFFIEDGERYHHILNPATGESAGELRSVTVIGPDATLTDGLSTSVFVLGPGAGLELIESLDGYEALIIDTARRIRFSSGFDTR